MQTPYPRHDQRRMPGWVIALIIAPLALCVTCASVGYFAVWPRFTTALEHSQEAVSDQIAASVYDSLSAHLAVWPVGANTLVIQAAHLDVNNADIPGEWGMKSGTDGTYLWGIDTQISQNGIALLLGDVATYSGIPEVTAGHVELTNVVVSGDIPRLLLSADGFANGMARGINRSLEERALVPTSIRLGAGAMTIAVAPHTEHDLHREPIRAA